eukprot:TRINITY_DN90564_c0_g1_i1.p1 TRINITY_DN90564_c0_g1~~TRINITY_DN90564_c0_g1_i1.p1  ORF type:complete len:234 (-),score=37.56 TRINITY_DN90564_c0_g1_i1:50-751(-)
MSAAFPAGVASPSAAQSRLYMEPPWDRLEPEEQAMIEAYCAEFERAVTGSGDSVTFLERAALVDQRCTEAWFANDFGSAHADPMQAFRQLPTGGVVHPVAQRKAPSSNLGAHGSEIFQRHLSFLEHRMGPVQMRSSAGPSPQLAGQEGMHFASGAGGRAGSSPVPRPPPQPPQRLPVAFSPRTSSRQALFADIGQSVASTQCPNCGNVYLADAVYCRQCGQRRAEAGMSWVRR